MITSKLKCIIPTFINQKLMDMDLLIAQILLFISPHPPKISERDLLMLKCTTVLSALHDVMRIVNSSLILSNKIV